MTIYYDLFFSSHYFLVPELYVVQDIGVKCYPTIFDSLIGEKMVFKIENKDEEGRQLNVAYPAKKVCIDDDITAMFQLQGAEVTPTKVFLPYFLIWCHWIMFIDLFSFIAFIVLFSYIILHVIYF